MKTNSFKISFVCLLLFGFFTAVIKPASAGTVVTEIKATYQSGQVFITWKCPNTKKLAYKVYRSTTKFTTSSQLNSNTYLGQVRDSSSKNIRKTRVLQQDVFFRITNNGVPLDANKGLYVVTCTGNQSYYYAVTATVLSTNIETKTITLGENSLSIPVAETLADPQPVLQDSVNWSQGDVAYEYVQFVNNQDLPHYPAMTNVGSYGFNFNLVKRGQATKYPLYVFFEGLNNTAIHGDGIAPFDSVTNCYIISVDDYLPDPNGNYTSSKTDGTFWCCYHEKFDMYSSSNPIPTTGTVRTYAQKRYIKTISWAQKKLPLDTSRTYLIGLSAGGFGALLTAVLIPQKIAAVYVVVSPILLKAIQGDFQKLWGAPPTNLPTDVPDPATGSPILIWSLLDIKRMMRYDANLSFPLVFAIHGKYDVTVGWSDKPKFYDSTEAVRMGGVYFWDQRQHDRTNANFLDEETMPDLDLYQTTKSYPAFSNCSINQNPGNGTPTNGDPYGAINGYLTWKNDEITDEHCSYQVKVSIKDFYVGGVLDGDQYNTCTTDITFRRLQQFNPPIGSTIKWKNFDYTNSAIQSGSFVYNGGLITLTGLQVNKSGNRISLSINGCQKMGAGEPFINPDQPEVTVIRTNNGYELHVDINHDEEIRLNMYDLLGRIVDRRTISLLEGENIIFIPTRNSGTYITELEGATFSESKKLVY